LNSVLGLVRAGGLPQDLDMLLERVQHQLFSLGAEVAAGGATTPAGPTITADHVRELEAAIDRFEKELPPLRNFILPGGAPVVATLHLARPCCRRTERRLVGLSRCVTWPLSPVLTPYRNQLGDLLFVLRGSSMAGWGRWTDYDKGDCDKFVTAMRTKLPIATSGCAHKLGTKPLSAIRTQTFSHS
jgi:ATP:cob(I)alamin adenosyltransferase